MQEWEEARSVSQRVLDLAHTLASAKNNLSVSDVDKGKAYFRHGQALMKLGQYENALESLNHAHKILPSDGMIIKMIHETEHVLKQRELKEKKMYQNMFA